MSIDIYGNCSHCVMSLKVGVPVLLSDMSGHAFMVHMLVMILASQLFFHVHLI